MRASSAFSSFPVAGRIRAALRDERGSTLTFTLGLAALALAAILLAVDASALYLERARLASIADGAAMAASEAFALETVAVDDGGARPVLSTIQVERSVDAWLDAVPGGEGVDVLLADASDGRGAEVRLSTAAHPPVSGSLVPRGFRISATSYARSVFED